MISSPLAAPLPLLCFAALLTLLGACKGKSDEKPAGDKAAVVALGGTPPTCDEGFEVRDGQCMDIDECGGVATPCGPHPEAMCRNTPGAYECTCPKGYVGGGFIGCSPAIAELGLAACVLANGQAPRCWQPSPEGYRAFSPAWAAGLSDVRGLVGHHTSGCALTGDGKVECWADLSPTADGKAPSPGDKKRIAVPGLSDATALAGGAGFACALRRNGAVMCWGANYDGQLGNGKISDRDGAQPVQGVSDAAGIATGLSVACVVRRSGELACWGHGAYDNRPSAPDKNPIAAGVAGLTKVVQVAVDSSRTCVVHADRTMSCWGHNRSGGLGIGDVEEMHTPTKVPGMTGVVWLQLSSRTTSVHRTDGSLWHWGELTESAERGETVIVRVPEQVPEVQGAIAASMPSESWCALLRDGRAACGAREPWKFIALDEHVAVDR